MKNLNKIPEFKNYKEEAEFWDTHDFSEFWNDAKLVDVEFLSKAKKDETVTIRMEPKLKEKLEKLARSYGINLSTLTRMWIIEKLRQL